MYLRAPAGIINKYITRYINQVKTRYTYICMTLRMVGCAVGAVYAPGLLTVVSEPALANPLRE